jgi:lysine-N-methylase
MIVRVPDYFSEFSCIAGDCKDSCCLGWEIDIDDKSYEYYKTVGGAFGEMLRQNIKEYENDEEDAYESHGFILKEGRRCPFLNENQLCVIYQELGEQALCDVCTDTPRDFLEYGGARELALSASCPEAGRLIYRNKEKMKVVEKEISEPFPWEETEDEKVLADEILFARNQAITILQNRSIRVEERVCACLEYAKKVQDCLNQDSIVDIHKIPIELYFNGTTIVEIKAVTEEKQYGLFLERLRLFSSLESIRAEWDELLLSFQKRYMDSEVGRKQYISDRKAYDDLLNNENREYEKEQLIVYYCFLCLARCVDDYDFLGKMKLAVTSFLMVRDMNTLRMAEQNGEFTVDDQVVTARIYAKEVEHSEWNLEYMADEFLFGEAYTPENLCVALTRQ